MSPKIPPPPAVSMASPTVTPTTNTAVPSKDGSEPPTPSNSSSRNPSPPSISGASLKDSELDTTASGTAASTSQPMAKTSSSSSNSTTTDAKDAAAATGPSPYGTRSRNRTGRGARVNYAEDKDLDMLDFDAASEKKGDGEHKKSRPASANATANAAAPNASNDGAPRSNAAPVRKPLPTSDAGKSTTSVKEHLQHNHVGTAALPPSAANPAVVQQPSKKRKATQAASATSKDSSSNGAVMQKPPSVLTDNLGPTGFSETNMMSFENCGARIKNNALTADDGTVLAVNDHVYSVCEPPGEPYYIGRIMEFLHKNNDPSGPVDALRLNWFYRPKDISKRSLDTRQLYASMHSDISPLHTLRGKCTVKHRAEIVVTPTKPKAEEAILTEYRKTPDNFWWSQMYDRYISKSYDAIPTSQVINVPERVKKVLDLQWKWILVEQGRGKELTSAVKSCKRCNGYCANANSVDCGFCNNTYHMQCVRPPLQKKPARGFGWACGPCNAAQERKLEALNAPHLQESGSHAGTEDEEYLEEGDEDDQAQLGTNRTSPEEEEEHPPPTAEQLKQASLWVFRYLGVHCKIEDALDYDDRIFPRASSRLGPRHQATVLPWPGRPVEYVKPLEIKRSGRKDGRQPKEVQALIDQDRRERENRPKWVQDQPFSGYIARGEDLPEDDPNCTSTCLWKPIEDVKGQLQKDSDGDIIISEAGIDEYMDKARAMWKSLNLPERSTNLEDVARNLLYKNNYNTEKALQALATTDKAEFKEPELTPLEAKMYDQGVSKFGANVVDLRRYIKTVPAAVLVRYYYKWKKTPQGKKIWGNWSARKGKKELKKAQVEASVAVNEIGDDHDDSAFDCEKARAKKRAFICRHCDTKTSRQWRRAPGIAPTMVTETGSKSKDKGAQYIVALCRRCAELWRRYAIQYEDLEEITKKAAAGGRTWKKKIDEELLKELQIANQMMEVTNYQTPEPLPAPPKASATPTAPPPTTQEPPRKKLKSDRDSESVAPESANGASSNVAKQKEKQKDKEKPVEKPAEKIKPKTPPPPPMPKPRTMPCDICFQMEPMGEENLQCKECRMTVHRTCYGVIDSRQLGKWVCDMCTNDKNPQCSLLYKCTLCPIEYTEHDFVEPPKISHKKKTEKERERERQEKEMAQKAAAFYRQRQQDSGRPLNPREPLKRTADNNWVHVTCAVFTPEIKFGNARALEPSEGIPSIPRTRFQEACKVCKTQNGACVACQHCRAPVHVECAYQAGYTLGFDISPVKGSRRDQHNIVSIRGESGTMTAGIWCKEHPPKTTVYQMHDLADESGTTALQLYVRNFKQADLTLTGCARKANLIPSTAKALGATTNLPPSNRRASSTTTIPPQIAAPFPANGNVKEETPEILQPTGKVCITCGTDVSPKWYAIDESQERTLANGYNGELGAEAQKFMAQRNHQCHKCKRANRQPRPVLVKEEEKTPPPPSEVSRSSAQAVQAVQVANSPQNLMSVNSIAPQLAPQPWDQPPRQPSVEPLVTQPPPIAAPNMGQPLAQPPAVMSSSGPPPPMAPPVAAPIAQPPQPLPPQHAGQPIAPPSFAPSMPPRSAPPPQQYAPPPQAPSYNDWRRPSSQHGPPPPPPTQASHHMNGGPSQGHTQMPSGSMTPLAAPNHLRPHMPHQSGPPMQNGHAHNYHGPPPMMNGMPPSPRGYGGPPSPRSYGGPQPQPPMPNGGSYISQYPPPPQHHQPQPSSHHQPGPPPPPMNHQAPQPPYHLMNGGAPSRQPEHFGQAHHPQRSPFSTSHGSSPGPRESSIGGRDGGNVPQRPPENRQPSGASASPSLRNLLH